jgi:hypothetical protein
MALDPATIIEVLSGASSLEQVSQPQQSQDNYSDLPLQQYLEQFLAQQQPKKQELMNQPQTFPRQPRQIDPSEVMRFPDSMQPPNTLIYNTETKELIPIFQRRYTF